MKRDAALGPGAFGFHAEPRGQPSRVGEGAERIGPDFQVWGLSTDCCCGLLT